MASIGCLTQLENGAITSVGMACKCPRPSALVLIPLLLLLFILPLNLISLLLLILILLSILILFIIMLSLVLLLLSLLLLILTVLLPESSPSVRHSVALHPRRPSWDFLGSLCLQVCFLIVLSVHSRALSSFEITV